MYKYTARPDVLQEYNSIVKNSKAPWDDLYFHALKITRTSAAYFAIGNFWNRYKSIEYYGSTQLIGVPLNGVILPSEWFLETEI